MHCKYQAARRLQGLLGMLAYGVKMGFVFVMSTLVYGQATATTTAVLPAVDHEELASLTLPQQKARQLATILIGKPESTADTPPTPPLGIIAEQTMRLGKRGVIILFNASHVEGRLTGGYQTFVSPVDHAIHSIEEDAQRPLFVPPSQGIVGLDVLVK